MRPGVDAVLLDIDDTLVDTRASFTAGMRAVADRYLGHLGDSGPEAALEHWLRDPGGYFPAFAAGRLGFVEQRRLRAAAMHHDLGGADLDDDTFAAWNRTYEQAFRAAWATVTGAVDLLERLARCGVPIGAVTNTQVAYQRDKLERTGLVALPILVGTDTLGVGKPDPRVFRHACALLGVDPGRTVYVGNDLAVDAQAAAAAGLLAVWFDRSHEPAPAAPSRLPVVRSLAELAHWLDLPASPHTPSTARLGSAGTIARAGQ